MNEAPRNMPRAEPHAAELTSDQAVENAALAGAAAIQRIVAERNGLRSRLGAQHREIVALRSINEDLRRRLILIHQQYVELAKQVVGHLEHFDGTVREVVQEAHSGAAHRGDAAPAASLVQRLAEADHADSEHAERTEPARSS